MLTRSGSVELPVDPRLAANVGHHRDWSPWFANPRIVTREGGLVLVAPVGVEASGDDHELVEAGDGELRLGADPWLPDRVTFGPVVDGTSISLV